MPWYVQEPSYNKSSFWAPHMLFKLFLFCTLYSFCFFFCTLYSFSFFSMMSCHVVSLISKAFLLFRDTFDDRSVVTSYFLFVLAWLLTSYIYSWFIKLLFLLHYGFKLLVVAYLKILFKFGRLFFSLSFLY